MTSDERRRSDPWGRGLDLVGLLAFGFVGVGAAVAFSASPTSGLVVVLSALVAGAMWARLRRRRDPAAAYALLASALVCTVVPDAGPYPAILLLVSVAVLGLVAGAGQALAIAVVLVVVLAVGLVIDQQADAVSIASQSAGAAALLLLAAGLGGLLRSLGEARDRAVRRGVELERANDRLRESIAIERELALARERERTARELHDGLGHRLTLAGMSLRYAERTRESDAESAWAEVASAGTTVQDALDLMRLWVRALAPPRPSASSGPGATFEQIAESFRGTGLEVTVEQRGVDVPLSADLNVYTARIVQEGLINVLRHAAATRVHIEVAQSPGSLRLVVTDDGAGAEQVHEGFGLRSLRERAEALGGSLATGPAPGGGWQVAVVLPVAGRADTTPGRD